MNNSDRPLVAHALDCFYTGGPGNGVVKLINYLPRCRHAVIALPPANPAWSSL